MARSFKPSEHRNLKPYEIEKLKKEWRKEQKSHKETKRSSKQYDELGEE